MRATLDQRDRPALTEDCENAREEACRVVLQFGDLGCESNRIRLIEAMIADLILPGDHDNAHRLEAAIVQLPRRTMNEVIATRAKLGEAQRKRTALVLEAFQLAYVSHHCLEAGDPALKH